MTEISSSSGPAPIPRRRARRRSNASLGDVLGKTFSIWGRNLVPFALMALMIYWPFGLVKYWLHSKQAAKLAAGADVDLLFDGSAEGFLVLFLVLAEMTVMLSLLMGTLTALVVGRLRDQPLDLGEGIREGLRSLPRVLGVSITMGTAMGLALGLPLLLMMIHGAFGLLFVGSFIVIVMLWVRWFVAVPAAVVEKLGVGATLSRSAYLVRSYGRSVFWMGFLMNILAGLMQMPFAVAGAVLANTPSREYMADNVWIPFVSFVLIAPLTATFPAVVYHTLREAKDGPATEQLADVFA